MWPANPAEPTRSSAHSDRSRLRVREVMRHRVLCTARIAKVPQLVPIAKTRSVFLIPDLSMNLSSFLICALCSDSSSPLPETGPRSDRKRPYLPRARPQHVIADVIVG